MSSDRSEIQARRFYSQRNMYLCGFTLFLSFVLNRTYNLVLALFDAEDTVQSLKTSSNDKIKADLLEGESKNEVARLKKLLEQKETDIEILKKQSEALSKEYMHLSDEVNKKNGEVSSNKKTD